MSINRDWLEQIEAKIDLVEEATPEQNWLRGDWPDWVKRVAAEVVSMTCPTLKARRLPLEAEQVGGLVGQKLAYAMWHRDHLPKPEDEQKRIAAVFGKPLDRSAVTKILEINRQIRQEIIPQSETLAKFALGLACEQGYGESRAFLRGFVRALEKAPGPMGAPSGERSTWRIYMALLVSWRTIEVLPTIAELHRRLCHTFEPHLVGDLKRTEKLCQRVGLHLGKVGRPHS